MTVDVGDLDSLTACVPDALRHAIHLYVRVDQQTEVLLDVAERIEALSMSGETARVARYVSETVRCLSMDRDELDPS